ncbi:GNAT family N-acetyltransferase [Paenibacillus arenilitoris]|uniref:GNAT family N-acetyltransferase n=1 Tax=Paenibacillus arenilitoris TaxID=2772299 RepID=A0A927H819_9BACL|nr:GNAT family N-acetyltransferase [Paenibacillus arenilitoris]MBD2870169.1 GNAT family N-acetyltransferase [Paenibacillus arenilitoris]
MTQIPYELEERLPTVAEHRALWEAVGWGTANVAMTGPSLARSLHGVVIRCGEDIVGMGRIVGDGAMYYYIQDVAVLPAHQGKGLGLRIMDNLLAYVESHCEGAGFVGLFASHGNDSFYRRFGFANYAPGMTGMFKVLGE